ncbi:cyclin-T2 isoform X1 [Esox lucius]|uniref:cyclin-T2 isoform X1 n=2 Tax=Esox lucius TaxID=8010 RepID=UPI0005765ACF|nr:cyclin-T2 isoform X1 [Esox lucius]
MSSYCACVCWIFLLSIPLQPLGASCWSAMAVHRGPSSKWLFSREQLETTPSRRSGVESDRELSYRQQAANLIQDMGQRLNVSQLIINTAIVYMHRFYMIHSFTKFHRNIISQTTLFLAAKVEEQPRKLEHVIKVAHACVNPQDAPLDTKSNAYHQQAQELVILETIVLQTLGFEITIEHPHTDVVRCSQLVRASKDLAQTSYFMATNSLHLTTFCLQHKPTVIACVCIHLACKWSNWEIPVSTDGKHWWEYLDRTVTLTLLDELTHEFLQILEKTPSRLKRIRNWRVGSPLGNAATQAAKKPKTDGQPGDSSFQGTSSLDSITGVAGSNSFFPSSSLSDSGEMPSLDDMSAPFPPYQALAGDQAELLGLDQGPSFLHQSLPSKYPSAGKHEHKVGSAGKHPQALPSNPSPFARPPQKLSLDKYREKHAADLQAMQNGGREDPGGVDMYQSPALPHPHKRRSQPGHGVPQHGDSRRDKSSSKKTRGLPPQGFPAENGVAASNEELKMRIKVSAEREPGGHAGVPQGKEKHKEHSGHRGHPKHGHSHSYALSGNGRGPVDPALALRIPGSHGSETGGSSSSSRKRAHPDANSHSHHHHSSKSSRSSKGAGASSHYSTDGSGGSRTVERHHGGPEGSNGVLGSNGQHTDYKDTFDMLDSLLSAQGMNL